MKKFLLLLVLIGISQLSLSQVGINTTSPNAQLDIKSSNQATPANTDGILIPKIDAFPAVNPTAAQQGMMVYLTTVSAGKQPGFYYWDNATTSWIGFVGSKGWELLGNSGTTPATNFIGTTDNNDLVFKRFNIRAGFLGVYNTAFGAYSLNQTSVGDNNAAVGSFALSSNINGSWNTAVGRSALINNNDGSFNTGLGALSMFANTIGNYNVAIGRSALSANKTGSKAIAIGAGAMQNANDTETAFDNHNIAIGYQAIQGSATPANNTGDYNTAIGYQTLLKNTSGSFNSALGDETLSENTTGGSNLAFGYSALNKNTGGSNNTAIGVGALKANTASGNVAVGSNALLSNENGIHNTAVGTDALRAVTYASFNTAFGNNALMKNNAYGNTAIGASSMFNNEVGSSNVAVGRWTLMANISGSSNTAIGTQALWKNQTGSNNFALGGNAMLNNIDGGSNSAMGFEALNDNASGNNNTALGAGALKKAVGSDNIGIGMQAALNLVNGSNNVAIGNNAMSNLTDGSGNIVIGNNATVPSATESDQMSIANVIYGATMTSATAGKIGIGVTVPTEKLEVAGKTKTTNLQVTAGAANGRVLTSDATGNATWQINSGIDADFYEVGGTTPPDAITDNIYHTGNVCIGLNTNDNRYKLYATSVQLTANGIGQGTIYGYRDRDTRNDGIGYGHSETNSAIKGYNYQGDIYTFGVSGFCYNDFTRTGGVFGSIYNGTYWGSLGYKSSAATAYGVYASAVGYSTPAAGRMAQAIPQYTIGGGFYGGIIGSWSKGEIGSVSSGRLFASYNSGDEYTLGRQLEIVETNIGKRVVYTVTSTESVIYKKGKITLQNGLAHVLFDSDYAQLLGDIPVVTTTPMGQCNGIYIESIDKTGFTIKELNNGASNVSVSWIAVGDRIDAGQPVSREVLANDFDSNMNEVMFNENNKEGSAKAVWYNGNTINFGKLPENSILKESKK